MPISLHGHRPTFFRSYYELNNRDILNSNLPEANVQTVNLGFFKLKIDRNNARQASLLAQLPPRQKSKKEYFAEWDGWAQAGGSRENRTAAVRRIKAWLDNNKKNQPLDLSNLGLTSLPDTLPPNLRILYAYNNQLTSLPDTLPPKLRILYARGNQLTSLPDTLPPNLHTLNAGANRLTSLPDTLPPNLHSLNASGNQLTSLPDTLPPTLWTLEANGNQLTSLPDTLPPTLHSLNASGNQLTSLPDTLPPTLHTLHADRNQLTSLPDTLPPTLHTLDASDNQLTSLPDTLPPTLWTLKANGNQLTSLPDTLLPTFWTLYAKLPNRCNVYIDADHLSKAMRNRLEAAMNANRPDNGRIIYNMGGERILSAREKEAARYPRYAAGVDC